MRSNRPLETESIGAVPAEADAAAAAVAVGAAAVVVEVAADAVVAGIEVFAQI